MTMSDNFDEIEKMIAMENEANASGENEGDSTVENLEASDDQNFNESELEDIMAEIESLESDFETPEEHIKHNETLKYDSSKASVTDLQKEIDRELELVAKLKAAESDDSEVDDDDDEIPLSVQNAIIPEVEAAENVFEEVLSPAAPSTTSTFTTPAPTPKPIETFVTNNLTEESKIIPFDSSFENAFCEFKSKSEMSFNASGSMNLNLSFNVGDEEAKLNVDAYNGITVTMKGVELRINELHGCTVKMENGVSFNIPLTAKESSSKKKAA
jgi:hypothetical protein